jgi:hypothetical protein
MKSRRKAKFPNQSGQALVEFALTLPLLLLCLLSILYFGKLFLTTQIISHAAEAGAKVAGKLPNVCDPEVRQLIRGFTEGGTGVNPDSLIYRILGSGRLLSDGATGNLPPGAKLFILPWDGDGQSGNTPAGTVSVLIEYPFSFVGNVFGGKKEKGVLAITLSTYEKQDKQVSFLDFPLSHQATVPLEVYAGE